MSPPSQVSGQVTILVLDMSGTMSSNDDLEIRCSAAKSYIDLSRGDDQIGIIGLTNIDGQVDSKGFLAASIWQKPLSVKVDSGRQALKDVITNRPAGTPSCQYPFGATPIYDALSKALDMLRIATRTSHGRLPGSVILLSDGQPDPNGDVQMDKVRNELLPQFSKEKWPVDTVALKAQEKYHTFLQDLAHQSGGLAYDDTQGNIPGIASPLNITGFFITVLKRQQNRVVNTYVPVQTLNGTPWLNDFIPNEYTNHLDVFIAKDENVTATLTTPIGEAFPPHPSEKGIKVINDNPYYTIFSIETPRLATYQLGIDGAGQFLVYILETSSLQVSITSPMSSVQLLDHPVNLAAQVIDTSNSQNDLITGTRFALTAMIQYTGVLEKGNKAFAKQIDLSDKDGTGTYQNTFRLPPGSPPGLYSITVSVSGNTAASIGVAYSEIRLVRAPIIHLFSPKSEITAGHAVSIQQIQWSPFFQKIYDPDIPFTHWLGQAALREHSLYPQTAMDATIQVDIHSLSHLKLADAVVYPVRGSPLPLRVTSQREHFRFYLPHLPDGTYRLVLTLSGTFEDDSLKLDPVPYSFNITSVPPPQDWQQETLPITLPYMFLLFLCLIALPYWYLTGPSPFGQIQLQKDNAPPYSYLFKKARRNLFSAIFSRNTLYSETVPIARQNNSSGMMTHLPGGLVIRFYRHKKIKVRRRWGHRAASFWMYREGNQEKSLPFTLREVNELIHQSSSETGVTSLRSHYFIDPKN